MHKKTNNIESLQICFCICVYMWSQGCVTQKHKNTRFSACVHFVHQQTGEVGLVYSYFHPSGLAAMLCLAYSMYPCCKDNDVMNGESEGESGRKRE